MNRSPIKVVESPGATDTAASPERRRSSRSASNVSHPEENYIFYWEEEVTDRSRRRNFRIGRALVPILISPWLFIVLMYAVHQGLNPMALSGLLPAWLRLVK